ncbi:MAG: hypothetical protein JW822_00075 [Spirochaetales bacterium]|nr:hypothetical protein [Spirochaetales bacterium]
MPELKQNRQSAAGTKGVYTLFSILIPSTLLLSIDRVSREGFEFLNTIPWWFVLIAIACNIAASGVLSLLTRKRADFSSFIRINFFIYFPALGILTLFLYDTPQLIAYLAALLFIQWMIAHYIFNRFKIYMEFKNFVGSYTGPSLVSEMRTCSLLIRDSYRSLINLRKTVHIIQFTVFAAVSALLLAGVRLSIFSLLVCVSCVVTGLVLSITISTYLDEYRFYIDGVAIHDTLKRKRIAYLLIILLASLLLVLPILRDSSLFPPAYIVSALNYVLGLFPDFKFDIQLPDHLRAQNRTQTYRPPQGTGEYQEPQFLADLSLFFEILGIVIVVLLIVGVLYFLLKPLFKKGLKNLFQDKHPLKPIIKQLKRLLYSFKKIIKEIALALGSLFGFEKKRPRSAPQESSLYALLKPKRTSLKKRRQKNRVVKAFVILIKWGRRQKMLFHPALGPKEYINMVIERLPNLKERLIFIADTFEEAVFSTHIMRPATITHYISEIKDIIRS